MVFYGVVWVVCCCMVLYGVVWCCMVLYGVQPNCFEFEKERERCETTDLTRPGIPMGVFDHHKEGSELRRLRRHSVTNEMTIPVANRSLRKKD